MSFDSLSYLIFLPAVLLLHRACPPKGRWALLLAASLFFYASWNAPLTLLLLAVIAVSYLAGRLLAKLEKPRERQAVLILALALCLGLLLYFKYFHFLAGSLAALLSQSWKLWDVILPIGVSFYTFQALSYVIDVYQDAGRVERHFGYYALYVSFFPQLVAGPIERADRLLPQLRAGVCASRDDMRAGLRLLLGGYFRKLVIADFCAPFVNAVYAAKTPDGSAVFLGTLLFSLQIYNDFAGYSEIARGSARLFGVRLMRNFDRPYLALGFRDFWRRWHISLSQWFRDYLYIPLGGSRSGLVRRLAATLLVFALSGLWHGANWTFLIWGLFHGAALCLELLFRRSSCEKPWQKALGVVLTFLAVSFAWIFFRAASLPQAFDLILRLFSRWNVSEGLALLGITATDALWLGAALLSGGPLHRLSQEDAKLRDMTLVYLLLCIVLAWLIQLAQGGENAFIYFQF